MQLQPLKISSYEIIQNLPLYNTNIFQWFSHIALSSLTYVNVNVNLLCIINRHKTDITENVGLHAQHLFLLTRDNLLTFLQWQTVKSSTVHTHQRCALSLLHGSDERSSAPPSAEPHLYGPRGFPPQSSGELSGSDAKVGLSLRPIPDLTVHHCFACWLVSCCKTLSSGPQTPAA